MEVTNIKSHNTITNTTFFVLGSEVPSTRFRILPFLSKEELENVLEMWPAFNYSPKFQDFRGGRYLWFHIKNILNYIWILFRISILKENSTVFIQKQLHQFGSCLPEYLLRKKAKKIIYDFDDAIYLNSGGQYAKKWCHKLNTQLDIADSVIAGNQYLAEYAGKFNDHVTVIPTGIDTDKYYPLPDKPASDTVYIGWVGTAMNMANLNLIVEPMNKILVKYPQVDFLIISERENQTVLKQFNRYHYLPWSAEMENQNLNKISIGIMPLVNNGWTRGKCAFKLLQYMAVASATVSSDVGANKEVVKHGTNGYLAHEESEWFNSLEKLVSDAKLRQQHGQMARKTILDNFSIQKLKIQFRDAVHG